MILQFSKVIRGSSSLGSVKGGRPAFALMNIFARLAVIMFITLSAPVFNAAAAYAMGGETRERCRGEPPFPYQGNADDNLPTNSARGNRIGWGALVSPLDRNEGFHYSDFLPWNGQATPAALSPVLFWWDNAKNNSHRVATGNLPLLSGGDFVTASTDSQENAEFAILTSNIPFEDSPGRSRSLFIEVVASGKVKQTHALGVGLWGVGQPYGTASNAPGFLLARSPGEPRVFASVRHNAVDLIPLPPDLPLGFSQIAWSASPQSPVRVGAWRPVERTIALFTLNKEKRIWLRERDTKWDLGWPIDQFEASDAYKHYVSIDADLSAAFVRTEEKCLAILMHKSNQPQMLDLTYCFRTPLTSGGITWLGVKRATGGLSIWGVNASGFTNARLEDCGELPGELALFPTPSGVRLGLR